MNYKKLQEAVSGSKLTKTEIARQCGVTRMTLDNAIMGGDTKISTIEKLAKVLHVSMSYLFDETSINVSSPNVSGALMHGDDTGEITSERITYLEKLLQEKERTIQILMNK